MDTKIVESEESDIQVELESSSSHESSLADLGDRGSSEDSEFRDQVNIRAVDDDESRESLNLGEDSSSRPFPPTALVIRINPNIRSEAVAFLIKKIKSPKKQGGAELLVRSEPFAQAAGELFVLHVTADPFRYLEVAEYLGMKKTDDKGDVREFHVKEMDSFLIKDLTIETLVTPAEKIFIVLHELETIISLPRENLIPSHPEIVLSTGQSIFQVYVLQRLIHSYYPLHDPQDLQRLATDFDHHWFLAFWDPAFFEEVRRYLGDSITMFFAFSGFYTKSLVLPACLTILTAILSAIPAARDTAIVAFSIFNLIYTSVVLKRWKRECSEMAYTWGTINLNKWDVEPRLFYTGKIAVDPVTGRLRPRYPWWKTSIKSLVSLMCVCICMACAAFLCYLYFELIAWAKPYKDSLSQPYVVRLLAGVFPSAVYATTVSQLTGGYRFLMRYLTEWENHRTQPQFDKNLVRKLVLFESVNNFGSFFYIAFILMDLSVLGKQLMNMLILLYVLVVIQEIFIPLFLRRTSTTVKIFLSKTKAATRRFHVRGSPKRSTALGPRAPTAKDFQKIEWNPKVLGIIELEENDPRVAMSQIEGDMVPYRDCFDDYQQLFIQFGYTFLFSPVVQWGIVISLMANIGVIYANVYKLCYVYQRPIPKRVKDIGAWQGSFELMSYVSVITNISSIVIHLDIRNWPTFAHLNDFHFFLLLASLEHFLIFLKLCYEYGVSNVPYKVALATTKVEYKAREAFKKEQQLSSRRRLTKRFQPINFDLRQAFKERDESQSSNSSRNSRNT